MERMQQVERRKSRYFVSRYQGLQAHYPGYFRRGRGQAAKVCKMYREGRCPWLVPMRDYRAA